MRIPWQRTHGELYHRSDRCPGSSLSSESYRSLGKSSKVTALHRHQRAL